MQTVAIERVKKGEYFRHKGKEVVYIAKGYEQGNGKWRATRVDNGYTTFIPKGTIVEIDFEELYVCMSCNFEWKAEDPRCCERCFGTHIKPMPF